MKIRNIIYMVAIVVDQNNRAVAYKLFNLGLTQCVTVYKEKVLKLLKSGYKIGNMRLNERERIELVPRNCSANRYTWLDTSGGIKAEHITNVVISKYKGKYNREVCIIYNNIRERVELFEYDIQFGNNIDYCANCIDLTKDIENTFYDETSEYWNKLAAYFKKFRHKIDSNLNLKDFAIYLDGIGRDGYFLLDSVLWVENMHHVKCDTLDVCGVVYGIAYQGIKNVNIKKLRIKVQLMESESIVNSSIENLIIAGDTWFTGTSLIKNCKIKKLTIGELVQVNKNLLDTCEIEEIVLQGENSSIQSDSEILKECKGLKYVILDKNISDDSYEIISKLIGGTRAKIILQEASKK